MINVELLEQVRDYIVKHPDEWKQSTWIEDRYSCGTTRCIAGTAVFLKGYQLIWKYGSVENVVMDNGKVRHVAGAAEEALGLTYEQACDLFYSGPLEAMEKIDGLIQQGTCQRLAEKLRQRKAEAPAAV
jgi:hypothetical protein